MDKIKKHIIKLDIVKEMAILERNKKDKVLQVKSRYNDWIKKRLLECYAIGDEDFEGFTENLVTYGYVNERIIKLDTTKEMAMLECNEMGKQVHHYFIQAEKNT